MSLINKSEEEYKKEIEKYKELARRNNWYFTMGDDRPYFNDSNGYATPDETTSEEDKALLAEIISEDSEELANLIINCWNNGLKISGPCSGIREAHKNEPYYMHFCFKGDPDILIKIYDELQTTLPQADHLNRVDRYDIDIMLNGRTITKEESNQFFKTINNALEKVLSERGIRKTN